MRNTGRKSITRTVTAALLSAAVAVPITSALAYFLCVESLSRAMGDYLSSLYKIERLFIENYPIYADHATPRMEAKLRTFLLNDHLRVARKTSSTPLTDDRDIDERVKQGQLVALDPGPADLYYFYNVPRKYRYLTPETRAGLEKLVNRFQEKLRARADVPMVKTALSSVLRPVEYQKDLRGINMNASQESTHAYGTSVDIFYDDFYIILPVAENIPWLAGPLFEKIRQRQGYLLGDSLRRQLQAMLMETLIELQDEGVLYAIYEKKQRCYHITVL